MFISKCYKSYIKNRRIHLENLEKEKQIKHPPPKKEENNDIKTKYKKFNTRNGIILGKSGKYVDYY